MKVYIPLKETAAPTRYSVNDTDYTVKITPTYDGSGKGCCSEIL